MNPELERCAGWPRKKIAGVDEAGRGCWAGPVVAAAVILPASYNWDGLDDSKKLSAEQRARLSARIQQDAVTGLGIATAAEIDASNILIASLRAMARAVAMLTHAPDHILVDGNRLPDWSYAAEAVIGGDARAPSIAAASIIAKHARDEMMVSLDEQCPGYSWAQNKGYGVPAHREGLEAQGVSPEHRRTFAPIRRLLEQS
ncbi:MAG: ribonuclease HII [Pseudomonadota bacterium]|nr:ribonuclease HII [Pseudomonadota bacterium]